MTTVLENSNSIERSIIINAPRERVWNALANAEQFGAWFGVALAGHRFEPGQRVRAPMSACGHDNVWFDVVIDRIEAPQLFSFRWHPCALDAAVDYAQEEPTLVTFTLQDAPQQGTLLTVVESGFDKVPPQRRLQAFRMNSQGWDAQLNNIVRHVSR